MDKDSWVSQTQINNASQETERVIRALVSEILRIFDYDPFSGFIQGKSLSIVLDISLPCPQCCSKTHNKAQKFDYIVYLNSTPDKHGQMLYQLAHEMTHFFMCNSPDDEKYRWIAEVLCASASLFALKNLSPDVKSSIFKGNESCFDKYLQNHLIQYDPDKTNTPNKLLLAYSDTLEDQYCERRFRNNRLAFWIYEEMEHKTQGWSAVPIIVQMSFRDNPSSKGFLERWRSSCITDEQRTFVSKLINLFYPTAR